MISILASEADRPVVREFFELFKTPWQFHMPGAPFKILLSAGQEVPISDAALVIIFSGARLASDEDAVGGYESKTV
ncbi:MAG TPA: hypothetical protein VH251_11105, partial [Verrucomicrobiae bacterium]|nr:hypothetical protein [Verrucomicrobiae bacterium]